MRDVAPSAFFDNREQRATETRGMNEHSSHGESHLGGETAEGVRRKQWSLQIADAELQQTAHALELGQEITIGTGPTAQLRVVDPSVSAQHVQLVATRRGVWVRDLGASGLYIGSALVQSALLTAPVSSFVIGRTTVCVSEECARGQAGQVGGGAVTGLVGASPRMRQLAASIRRIAALGAPVLVLGESGTGKDVVARALHALSGRRGKNYAMNVAALNHTLIDAELFGYRRGAFTGAVSSRAGAFEDASNGTLFLDEIGDLDLNVQVKLLRVIEEQRVRPLGSNQEIETPVRIVSATWAPLEERVESKRFRSDLYHRISTIRLEIPPLRQRKSDIPELARHLLGRYESELGARELTPAALSRLLAYRWPGNVRELGAVLYRAASSCDGLLIDAAHVDRALPRDVRPARRSLTSHQARQLLDLHQGNVSAAARAARVPRTTFRAILLGQRTSANGGSTQAC